MFEQILLVRTSLLFLRDLFLSLIYTSYREFVCFLSSSHLNLVVALLLVLKYVSLVFLRGVKFSFSKKVSWSQFLSSFLVVGDWSLGFLRLWLPLQMLIAVSSMWLVNSSLRFL